MSKRNKRAEEAENALAITEQLLAVEIARRQQAEDALASIPRWAIREALSYMSLANMCWYRRLKT